MRKTVVVLGSIFSLLLGACLPIFNSTPGPGPTVDAAGTSDALFKTAVAQTLTAQPTLPPVAFVTSTAVVSVASPTSPATLAPTEIQSFTPLPDLTTTPATATLGPATPTGVAANGTPTLVPGQVTAIWTLAIRKYGTLPPAVPFTRVNLVNKANAEAYISLQVTMNDGKYSIIEYPVEGTIRIDAPVGSYLYVAWVGGNKMVGNFRLHQNDEVSIILYKDKVVIK